MQEILIVLVLGMTAVVIIFIIAYTTLRQIANPQAQRARRRWAAMSRDNRAMALMIARSRGIRISYSWINNWTDMDDETIVKLIEVLENINPADSIRYTNTGKLRIKDIPELGIDPENQKETDSWTATSKDFLSE